MRFNVRSHLFLVLAAIVIVSLSPSSRGSSGAFASTVLVVDDEKRTDVAVVLSEQYALDRNRRIEEQDDEECKKLKEDIEYSIILLESVVTIGDAVIGRMSDIRGSGVVKRLIKGYDKLKTAADKTTLDFKGNLKKVKKKLQKDGCELQKMDKLAEIVDKEARKHMEKVGDKIFKKAFKKKVDVEDDDMGYPPYAQIDLCQENCGDLCALDFVEIGWLTNGIDSAAELGGLLDIEQRLVRQYLDEEGMLDDSVFLTDLRQNMAAMLLSGFIKGRKKKDRVGRLHDLLMFAQNLEAACAGKGGACDKAQLEQEDFDCCDYHMCTKVSTSIHDDNSEIYLEQPVKSQCSGDPTADYAKTVLKVAGLNGAGGCVIDGITNMSIERCYFTQEQFDCYFDRGFIGVDLADYCGAEYRHWTHQTPVGIIHTWGAEVCSLEGPKSTWERLGVCVCKDAVGFWFDLKDQALVDRCPARFCGLTTI